MTDTLNGYGINVSSIAEGGKCAGADAQLLNEDSGYVKTKRWGYGGVQTRTLTLIEDAELVPTEDSISEVAEDLCESGEAVELVFEHDPKHSVTPGQTVYVTDVQVWYSEVLGVRYIDVSVLTAQTMQS